MPASSLASEDAGYPFCQVAAAVGEFLGGNLKFFTALFMLPTEPPVSFGGRGQMSQDHTELGCSLTRSTPRTQQGGFAKQGRGRGFVLSRGTRLPLGLFFPCSISHSPVTNTAELSTELEGGGRHCQMAPRGRSSYFATRLLFPFLFFCPCLHYSAHSLLNPSSRPSSSQPVAALLVIREASQGRCMWQL